MTEAIAGFSLYLFGIAFAPIYTPHLSEKYGRTPVYMAALPLWMLFVLGTGLAQNFTTVAVCRFLAGAAGGPALVLIEGTFADVWSAAVTGRYYAVLTGASYVGAACGEPPHLLPYPLTCLSLPLLPTKSRTFTYKLSCTRTLNRRLRIRLH
jgi:DHA1 family multidrug resistance protein-like MFS transporter